MKTLVAYYSLDGNTRRVAETIATAMAADLLYIRPRKEITAKGFWKYFLGGAQVTLGLTPKLAVFDRDPADYDLILLGSPVWAGSFTPPVKAFLRSDAVRNKKIAIFYSHLGGADKTSARAQTEINRNNTFIGSLGLQAVAKHPEASCSQAVEWAKKLTASVV